MFLGYTGYTLTMGPFHCIGDHGGWGCWPVGRVVEGGASGGCAGAVMCGPSPGSRDSDTRVRAPRTNHAES